MPSAVWGRGLPNLLPAPSKTPAPAKCQGPPQPTPTLEPSRSLATLPSKGRSLLLVLTQSPPAQSGPGLSFPRWYTGGTRALAGLTLCHLACACLLTWGERGLPRTLKTGTGHCPLQPGARYHPVFLPRSSAAAHRSPEGLIWTVGSAQAVLWVHLEVGRAFCLDTTEAHRMVAATLGGHRLARPWIGPVQLSTAHHRGKGRSRDRAPLTSH